MKSVKISRLLCVGALMLANVILTATAQQVFPRRSAYLGRWTDPSNGVTGLYATAQEVCDERARVINWPQAYLPMRPVLWYIDNTGASHYYCFDTTGGYVGFAHQQWECPPNYDITYDGTQQYCRSWWPYVDRWHDKPKSSGQACVGNPIFPLTGNKRQSESLLRWSPSLPAVSANYDNRRKLPDSDPEGAFTAIAAASFGVLWESSLHKRMVVQQGGLPGYYKTINVSRGSGVWTSFSQSATDASFTPDSDLTDRLVVAGNGWLYVDANAQTQEIYDSLGTLKTVAMSGGGSQIYFYSDGYTPISIASAPGLLIRVEDQYGRAVHFEYEQPTGTVAPRVSRIIDPDGQAIRPSYDAAGNLKQLDWADGFARQFLYERSDLSWALTGIVDENNERHSTYMYDADGRAQSTEYAGGVNRYSLSYVAAPRWATTETVDSANGMFWRDHNWQLPEGAVMNTPNGSVISLGATLINGMPRVTTRSQPAGAGCDASSSSLTYDANGNVVSKTDFNGAKSCHAYDRSRNLETARVDGLGAGDMCPPDIDAFNIAAEASQRKTATQWHPAWSLPIKQAEPKKVTISVYNGQPDPTAGNATSSCAPTTAVLPDGSRIAVLCKKVEQATTDATGSLGFNATVTGTPRTWTYTYNQYGQALTARDPLNKLTTYAYYSDTTDQHTRGDLQSVTDSVGRVTQYTRYDKSGRPMQSVDANGTVTGTTYTPRGWIKTVSVTPAGGTAQLAVYDYDGVGQLKKATLPDGSTLEYTYDAAHRLTSVRDAAGNSVTYTLDNMGNRTGEDLKDPSGTLARNITRVYDALNRAQSTTGTAP